MKSFPIKIFWYWTHFSTFKYLILQLSYQKLSPCNAALRQSQRSHNPYYITSLSDDADTKNAAEEIGGPVALEVLSCVSSWILCGKTCANFTWSLHLNLGLECSISINELIELQFWFILTFQEYEAIEDYAPKDKKSVKLVAGEVVEVVEKNESGQS